MSAKIRSRSSWGAKRPNGDKTLSGLAREVYLHHTVTAHLSEKATIAQEEAQMRSIEAIGYSRFGRYGQGISYNVVIFPSGRAYQGVSFNRRGAHTDQRNSTARSICFAGNYETKEPTKAQLETAAQILAEGYGKWWVKGAPLKSHRDIKATACPGRLVHSKRSAIVKRAAEISASKKPKATSGKLAITGRLDSATIKAMQRALGIKVTGKLVGMKTVNGRVCITGPDPTIRALQRRFKSGVVDGSVSVPRSMLISALQRHYKSGVVDGCISPGRSLLVEKIQRSLNAGTF